MSRYIDAEQLWSKLAFTVEEPYQSMDDEYFEGYDAGVKYAMNEIEQAPTADIVPKDVYDQIKWERDVALETLREHGLEFGERADKEVHPHDTEH